MINEQIAEQIGDSTGLNFRQRWASYLTIFVAVVGLGSGVFLRNRSLNATVHFENRQEGIAVNYPSNWLLEEATGDFVFRVQNPASLPFKTTLQISLLTVGPGARTSDIPDLLNMTRAATLPAYSPLAITPTTLPNGMAGIQMEYAYVSTETNPFLQTVPIVVRARDVIVLRTNQVVVITYRADSQSFDDNLHFFDSFLRTLEL